MIGTPGAASFDTYATPETSDVCVERRRRAAARHSRCPSDIVRRFTSPPFDAPTGPTKRHKRKARSPAGRRLSVVSTNRAVDFEDHSMTKQHASFLIAAVVTVGCAREKTPTFMDPCWRDDTCEAPLTCMGGGGGYTGICSMPCPCDGLVSAVGCAGKRVHSEEVNDTGMIWLRFCVDDRRFAEHW